MSAFEWSVVSIAGFLMLAFALYVVVRVNAQRAVASGSGSIRQVQAGRDSVEIGSITHHTQNIDTSPAFLAAGESIASSESVEQFEAQVTTLWTSGHKYVRAVSLYGRPFMPGQDILETLAARHVSIHMILVDPNSTAARDIARDKCRFSRTVQHYEVLSKTLQIYELNEDAVLARIREEASATKDLLSSLKRAIPDADVRLRYIESLPNWKGTIVDGERAVYLIYDVPRMDVPFRYCDDTATLRYYEQNYFALYWAAGKDVPL